MTALLSMTELLAICANAPTDGIGDIMHGRAAKRLLGFSLTAALSVTTNGWASEISFADHPTSTNDIELLGPKTGDQGFSIVRIAEPDDSKDRLALDIPEPLIRILPEATEATKPTIGPISPVVEPAPKPKNDDLVYRAIRRLPPITVNIPKLAAKKAPQTPETIENSPAPFPFADPDERSVVSLKHSNEVAIEVPDCPEVEPVEDELELPVVSVDPPKAPTTEARIEKAFPKDDDLAEALDIGVPHMEKDAIADDDCSIEVVGSGRQKKTQPEVNLFQEVQPQIPAKQSNEIDQLAEGQHDPIADVIAQSLNDSSPADLTPIRPEPNLASAAVARRAQGLVERGFSLAERGAFYSARAQFIQALRVVAQSLDVQSSSKHYTDSLAEGLRVMKEARDFAPRGSEMEADLNLETIIAAHRTNILKDVDLSRVTPLVALQQYFAHAEDALATAVGNEPVGSKALYGLAKLQPQLNQQNTGDPLVIPKSMTLYQAALLCDERNFVAANELGVLFAKYGQLEDAKLVLMESARVASRPEVWHNLAAVHERLGENDLAALARQEGRSTKAAPYERYTGAKPSVEWVDAKQFTNTPATPGPNVQTPPTQKPKTTPKPAKKPSFGFRPWPKR